jgi:hypothetical protein
MLRLIARVLFVVVLAVVMVWVSFTPIALPICLVVGALLLLAAVLPWPVRR